MINNDGLYEIYDMWHQPWWQRKEYLICIGAAFVFCAVALLALLVSMYKHRYSKVMLPWEQALRDMQKIKPSVDDAEIERVGEDVTDNGGAGSAGMGALYDKVTGDALREHSADRASMLFYVEMSKILKRYLYARYTYAVENSTDSETIAYVRASDFDKILTEMVAEILSGGQYVKFAGQKTVRENIKRHFNMGIEIVQKTIPSASK